jgi:riboflavin biosynthesis pyrimidine reductase
VLVEGGGEVIRSFLVGRTWDEMSVFLAPVLIGGRGAQAIAGGARDDAGFLPLGAQLVAARRFGGGVLVRLVPERRSRATA